MKRFHIVCRDRAGSCERIGTCDAPDIVTAQQFLAKRLRTHDSDGYVPGEITAGVTEIVATIHLRAHAILIVDATAEAAEKEKITHALSGQLTAETT
jgi:hypothetical protein